MEQTSSKRLKIDRAIDELRNSFTDCSDDPHFNAVFSASVTNILKVGLPHAVEFSKVTVGNVVNLGLNANPVDDKWVPSRVPFNITDRLKFYLAFVPHVTQIENEASSRLIINLFLIEVLLKDVKMEDIDKVRNSKYLLACELHTADILAGKVLKVGGRFDYVFGSKGSDGELHKPYFIILEAKRDEGLGKKAQCQLLAELYDIMLANEGTGRTVAYGVLTTGYVWQFFQMYLKQMPSPWHYSSSVEQANLLVSSKPKQLFVPKQPSVPEQQFKTEQPSVPDQPSEPEQPPSVGLDEPQSTSFSSNPTYSDRSQLTHVQLQHQPVHLVSILKPIGELVDMEEEKIDASHKYEWLRSALYDWRHFGVAEEILGILRYMLETG